MNIAIPNRYLLASNFQQCVVDHAFPAEVWCVASALSEVTEAASPYQLEEMTGLGYDQVREALERLVAKKLVRENVMSWKEFTTAKAKAGGSLKNVVARVAPTKAAPAPKPAALPAESGQRNAPLPAQQPAAMRLGSITPKGGSGVTTTSAWVRQDIDPAQAAAVMPSIAQGGDESGGRLLRPILEQIESIKGGGVEGQLLVYQVFLRVPYDLLCEEGIKSLHFVDDQTMIYNPKLLEAIVKAAKDVIGVDLR